MVDAMPHGPSKRADPGGTGRRPRQAVACPVWSIAGFCPAGLGGACPWQHGSMPGHVCRLRGSQGSVGWIGSDRVSTEQRKRLAKSSLRKSPAAESERRNAAAGPLGWLRPRFWQEQRQQQHNRTPAGAYRPGPSRLAAPLPHLTQAGRSINFRRQSSNPAGLLPKQALYKPPASISNFSLILPLPPRLLSATPTNPIYHGLPVLHRRPAAVPVPGPPTDTSPYRIRELR